jgi:hypothetical protein
MYSPLLIEMVGERRIQDIHAERECDRLAAQVGGPVRISRAGILRVLRALGGAILARRRFSTTFRWA